MHLLKKIFRFIVNASLIVGLSAFSLVRLTQLWLGIKNEMEVALFAFFGTVAGYNFVKYDALARLQKSRMRKELKVIAMLSFICLCMAGLLFFRLQFKAQVAAVVFSGLTVLYALPFFPNRQNARNWAGVKIYMVSLCWMGVTAVVPMLNAGTQLGMYFILICIRRFLLVFSLVLIFEIMDIRNDDPLLQTVPQKIGVRRTKMLGHFLLALLLILSFFNSDQDKITLAINSVVVIIIGLFLYFANDYRSKYYTLFWAEMIPVFWYALFLLAGIFKDHYHFM